MASDPEEYTPPHIWPSLSTDPSNFVGREKVLGQLNELLEKHLAVVVVGMNGIGKTELALQYYNKCEENYQDRRYWFDLRDRHLADVLANHQGITEEILKEEKIREEKKEEKLNNSELIQFCWNQLLFLSKKNDRQRVLVVLDSVNKGYPVNQSMLPPTDSHFKVLVMADEPDVFIPSNIIEKKYDLEKLEGEHAVKLLGKWADRQIDDKDKAANYLCNDLLDRSPLGIELAGHYLRKNQKITISQFNDKLSNEWISSTALKERCRIDSVLELSWQELDDQSKTLAKLLGLFAPRIIPFEFPTMIADYKELEIRLQKSENIDEETDESPGCKIFDWTWKQVQRILEKLEKLFPSEEKRLDPKEVFQNLADLRLIKWDRNNNVAILDTIVRDFLKEKAKEAEDIESLKETFVKIILKKGLKLKSINPKRFVLIAPHLDEVISNYTAKLKDDDFDLFIDVGNYYDSRRMYIAGSKWYEKWLEKANERLGGQKCSEKTQWKNLSFLCEKIDKYEENRPRYKRACQICEDISKNDSLTDLLEIVKILEPKLKKLKPLLICHLYKRIWELSKDKYGDTHQNTKDAKTKYDECQCRNSSPARTIGTIG